MPAEEAFDTQRPIRPVMSPSTVDTLAILALHQQVYAALRGRATPWFVRLLRQPEEVADFTDRGRRKMPALMCGADNNYLALTRRQIDTIHKAGTEAPFASDAALPEPPRLTPRNLSAQLHYKAQGNPISSRPVTAVANCCPGLEVDFRAVWRRMFKGLVLREWDSLVVDVDAKAPAEIRRLKGHRMLRVFLPGEPEGIPVVTQDEGHGLVGSRRLDPADHRHEPGRAGGAGMVECAGPRARRPSGQARNLRVHPTSGMEPRGRA